MNASNHRRGLVLEGGAMRGLFTAGILDVFLERGIRFDGLVGVSAGACFGCNFKSRQTGRVIRYDTLAYIDRRVAEGDAILIAPEKPLEISRVCHDPAIMQRVYDLGRKAADQAIAASNRGDWAWH
jgi:predicted patatin/cPLA2 family phospholipase